jgi:hypothetical protein
MKLQVSFFALLQIQILGVESFWSLSSPLFRSLVCVQTTCWGWAADALAYAVRSWSSVKMGGGVSGARLARLGLLGSVHSACVGVELLTLQLALCAPGPG